MKRFANVALVALTATTAATAFFSLRASTAHGQSLDDNRGAIEVPDSTSASAPANPTIHSKKSAAAVAPSQSSTATSAQTAPQNGSRVGRKAAEKYMMKKDTSAVASASESEPSLHYLAIHVGSFVTDNAYNWGHDSQTNIGRFNAGLTYRVSEWSNSIDVNVRVDYLTYQLDLGRASQLVFLPLITFPDVTSKFPLYFGVGAGAGVFFNQIQNQSSLSLDYQLIAGVRFFNLWQNVGAFVESGLKNHVHLTSTGQFNGTFLSVGSNFTF